MIDSLDLVIRQMILNAIPSLAGRIGFQPPDQTWRQRVSGGTGLWLNCALVDLREDRARRSNEIRVERDPQQRLARFHAPFLLRCHYLISVWNSASDSEAIPASMQEHGMLGRVLRVLLERAPLTPADILPPADLVGIPEAWRGASLDTEVLPPEGFGKLPEYWGTMGRNVAWRPVVWFAVTVPVPTEPDLVDGIVTTILTSIGPSDPAGEREMLLTIGGVARDAAGSALADATVSIADAAGHIRARATTDAAGRYVVPSLPAGTYDIAASTALPALAGARTVVLPASADNPVDLVLT